MTDRMPASERPTWKSDHRHTHPQRFARRQATGIWLCIEREINAAIGRHQLALRRMGLNEQSLASNSAALKITPQLALQLWIAEPAKFEDKPGVRNAAQNLRPGVQQRRIVFRRIVEATESYISIR